MNEEEEQRIIQPGQRARPQPQPLDSQESGPPALPPFLTPTVREQPVPRARGGMGRARPVQPVRAPTSQERANLLVQDVQQMALQAEEQMAFFNKSRTRAILDEVEARVSDPTQKDGATYTEDVFLPRKLAALKEMAGSGASPDDLMAWAKKELPAPYRPTDWEHKRRVWEYATVEGNAARLQNKALDYLKRLYGMSSKDAWEKTRTAESAAQVISDTENALERYAADNSFELGAESAIRGFMGPAIVKAWESLGDLTTPQAQMKAREVQRAFMQEAMMYRQKRLSDAGWMGTIEEIFADVIPSLPRQLGAQVAGALVGGTLGGGAAMGLVSAADAKVLGAPQHQIRREAMKGAVLGVFGSLGERGVIAASMKFKGAMPSLMARFLGTGAVSVASEYGVAKATGEEYTLKDAVSSFLLEGAFSSAETSPQAQRNAAWKAYSSGEEAKILDNRAASAAKMIEQAAGRPLTEQEFFGFYDAQSKVKSGRFRAEIMGNLATQIANERVAQQEAAQRLVDARAKFMAEREQRRQAERRGFGSLDEEAVANIGMQEGVPLETGGTALPMSEEELSQRLAAGTEQFEVEAAPAREAARQERARQLRAERGTEGPEYRAAEYRKALEEQFRAEREEERRMLDEAKKARVSAKAQQTLERMVDRAARLREQMLEAAGFEGEALPPPTTPPAPAVAGEAPQGGVPPSGVTEADIEARVAGEGEPSGWVPPQGAYDMGETTTPTAPQAAAEARAPVSPGKVRIGSQDTDVVGDVEDIKGQPSVRIAPYQLTAIRQTPEGVVFGEMYRGTAGDERASGTWWADSREAAKEYAESSGGKVYKAEVVLKRPFFAIDDAGRAELERLTGISEQDGLMETKEQWMAALEQAGYDGLVIDDTSETVDAHLTVVPFRDEGVRYTQAKRGLGGKKKAAAPAVAPTPPPAAPAEGQGKYDLVKDGIEGEAIDYRRVQNGNEYFEYAIGRVEKGAPLEVFRRSISNRGSYGGWRWETDVSKLKPAAPAAAPPAPARGMGGARRGKKAAPPASAPEGRPAPVAAVAGARSQVPVQGGAAQDVRYAVMEMADIKPSNDPTAMFAATPGYPTENRLQERDYANDPAEQGKVRANAASLRPDEIINTAPSATTGPSIVTPDGTVINGNSRAMSLKLAAASGNTAEYRRVLIERASQFGIDPESIKGMREPVLVRVVDMDPRSEAAAVFGRQGNITATQAVSPTKRAGRYVRLIDDEILDAINAAPDSTISEILNNPQVSRPFREALIRSLPPSEVPEFFNADKSFTVAGQELAQNILLMKAIPQEVVERMSPELRRTVSQSVPQLAQMVRTEGMREASDAFVNALDVLIGPMRNGAISPEVLMGQDQMFGEKPQLSGIERMMLDFVYRERGASRRMRDRLAALITSQEQAGLMPEPLNEMMARSLEVEERPMDGERMSVGRAGGGKKMASYFSGARTLEAGLGDVAQPVMAVEFDPEINAWANAVAGTSYPTRSVLDMDPAEIKALGLEHFHASPVCKNVSLAKIAGKVDELDVKSAEAVARVVREADVPVVTIENVPGYVGSIPHKIITDALTEAGYKHETVVVDAADYGGASMRARMITRAVKYGDLPALPPKTGPADWYETVRDLIPSAPNDSPRGKGGGEFWEYGRLAKQSLLPKDRESYIDLDRPIYMAGGSTGKTVAYARNAGGPAPTVTSTEAAIPRILIPDANGPEVIRVPDGKGGFTEKRFVVKRVTGRMMARLMGLPDSFRIPDDPGLAKKVIGNGMHTATTQAIIKPLLERPMDGERMSVGRSAAAASDARHAELEARVKAGDDRALMEAVEMVGEAAQRAGYSIGPVYHHGGFNVTEDAIPRTDRGFHLGTERAAKQRALSKPTEDFIRNAKVLYDEDGKFWYWVSGSESSLDAMTGDGGKFESKQLADDDLLAYSATFEYQYEADPSDLGTLTAGYVKIENPKRTTDAGMDWDDAISRAKSEGHDGIVYRNLYEDSGSDSYIIFDPRQLKSAEPFTYRSDGTLIPLSERFSAEEPDIRFSRGEGAAPPGGTEGAMPPSDPGLQSARAWAEQNLVPHLRAKPKSLRERFGPNPTAEQRAQHRREMVAWKRGAADLRDQLVDKITKDQAEAETVDTVRTGTKVDRLVQDLKSGKITREEFDRRVSEQMDAEMARREVDRARKATGTRIRGYDRVMEVLHAASRKGEITPEMVDIAGWLLSQNPELAGDLAVRVIERGAAAGNRGYLGKYNPAQRLVTLFKGIGDEQTVAHEILHHLERFMPAPMRAAIRAEYLAQLNKAVKAANGDLARARGSGNEEAATRASNLVRFLDSISQYHQGGSVLGLDKAVGMMASGLVDMKMYRLTQPSEFWAEDGSRILNSRYGASGIWARIRQWMTEFAQKVKSVFGGRSDAPVIRAMDYILKQSGAVETTRYGLGGRARTGDIYASRARAERQGLGAERFSVAAGGVPPEAGGGDSPVEGGEAPEGPGPGPGLGATRAPARSGPPAGSARMFLQDTLGESGGALRGKGGGLGDRIYEKIKMGVARGREIRAGFSEIASKVTRQIAGKRVERTTQQAFEHDGSFYYRWNAMMKGLLDPKGVAEENLRNVAVETSARMWNEAAMRLGTRLGVDGEEIMKTLKRGRTLPHDFHDYLLDVMMDVNHPDRQVVAQYIADATNKAIAKGEIPPRKAKKSGAPDDLPLLDEDGVDGGDGEAELEGAGGEDGLVTAGDALAYFAEVANQLSPTRPVTGAEGHLASEFSREWRVPDLIPSNMVARKSYRHYGSGGFVPLQKPALGQRLLTLIDRTARIVGAQIEFGRGAKGWEKLLTAEQKAALEAVQGSVLPTGKPVPATDKDKATLIGSMSVAWINDNMDELIGANIVPSLRKRYIKAEGGLEQAGQDFDGAMRTAFGRPYWGGRGRLPLTTFAGKVGRTYDAAANLTRSIDLLSASTLNAIEALVGPSVSESVQGAPPLMNLPMGALRSAAAFPGSLTDALSEVAFGVPLTPKGRALVAAGEVPPYMSDRSKSIYDRLFARGLTRVSNAFRFLNSVAARMQSYQSARTNPITGDMKKFLAKWTGKNAFNTELMAMQIAQRAGVDLDQARAFVRGEMVDGDQADRIWRMARSRSASITAGEGIEVSESSKFAQLPFIQRLFTFWRWHDNYVRRNAQQLRLGASAALSGGIGRRFAGASRIGNTVLMASINAVIAKIAYLYWFGDDDDVEREWRDFEENPYTYFSSMLMTQLLAGPLGTLIRTAGSDVVSSAAFLPGRIKKKGDAVVNIVQGMAEQAMNEPEGEARFLKGLEDFTGATKAWTGGEGGRELERLMREQRRRERGGMGLQGMPPMPGFGPR